MKLKQISLTMPEKLLNASKKYSEKFGYRSLQEFILDLIRKKVILEREERYRYIEEQMKKGRKVKKFSQEEAVKYLKSL